jgi:hypothetical protein
MDWGELHKNRTRMLEEVVMQEIVKKGRITPAFSLFLALLRCDIVLSTIRSIDGEGTAFSLVLPII